MMWLSNGDERSPSASGSNLRTPPVSQQDVQHSGELISWFVRDDQRLRLFAVGFSFSFSFIYLFFKFILEGMFVFWVFFCVCVCVRARA